MMMGHVITSLVTILFIWVRFSHSFGEETTKEGHTRHDELLKGGHARNTTRKWLMREQLLWTQAVHQMKEKGHKLKGFYHTSTWQPHWKDVVEEQLLIMDGKRQLNHFLDIDDLPKSLAYHSSIVPSPRKEVTHKAGLLWGPKHFSSVLEAADELFFNVAGSSENDLGTVKEVAEGLNLKNKDKLNFKFSKTVDRLKYRHESDAVKAALDNALDVSSGEFSTMQALHNYCIDEVKQGRKSFVFYLHNKGGCCSRKEQKFSPVASWREGMNTFAIEFPSICLRALLSGYMACGMEYQLAHYRRVLLPPYPAPLPPLSSIPSLPPFPCSPTHHPFPPFVIYSVFINLFLSGDFWSFSGNFWWASCDHVSALPALWTRFDAWIVEYFIFNTTNNWDFRNVFAENCGYSTHNCKGVDHYHQECPRSTYKQKLINYISKKELPFSQVATVTNNTEAWRRDNCGKLWTTPYIQQPWWGEFTWDKHPWKKTKNPIYMIG